MPEEQTGEDEGEGLSSFCQLSFADTEPQSAYGMEGMFLLTRKMGLLREFRTVKSLKAVCLSVTKILPCRKAWGGEQTSHSLNV